MGLGRGGLGGEAPTGSAPGHPAPPPRGYTQAADSHRGPAGTNRPSPPRAARTGRGLPTPSLPAPCRTVLAASPVRLSHRKSVMAAVGPRAPLQLPPPPPIRVLPARGAAHARTRARTHARRRAELRHTGGAEGRDRERLVPPSSLLKPRPFPAPASRAGRGRGAGPGQTAPPTSPPKPHPAVLTAAGRCRGAGSSDGRGLC